MHKYLTKNITHEKISTFNIIGYFAVVIQIFARRINLKYKYADAKEVERETVISGTSNYFAINDYLDLIAPVKSYWPNAYGLYNMAGNVEEFVKEKGISTGGSFYDVGSNL